MPRTARQMRQRRRLAAGARPSASATAGLPLHLLLQPLRQHRASRLPPADAAGRRQPPLRGSATRRADPRRRSRRSAGARPHCLSRASRREAAHSLSMSRTSAECRSSDRFSSAPTSAMSSGSAGLSQPWAVARHAHRQRHVAHLRSLGMPVVGDPHQQRRQPPGPHQRLLQVGQLDAQHLALRRGRAQRGIGGLAACDLAAPAPVRRTTAASRRSRAAARLRACTAASGSIRCTAKPSAKRAARCARRSTAGRRPAPAAVRRARARRGLRRRRR